MSGDFPHKPLAFTFMSRTYLPSVDAVFRHHLQFGRFRSPFESLASKKGEPVYGAGGTFKDVEVDIDGNLITSRTPDDPPALSRAIETSLLK